MLDKFLRDSAVACAVMAIAALAVRPQQPRVAAGIVGGGVLIGLSFWAIRGVVASFTSRGENGEIGRVSRRFALVKFFTRHAILALAAYAMMVRLRLDPIGMLIGVTSVVVAATRLAARRR